LILKTGGGASIRASRQAINQSINQSIRQAQMFADNGHVALHQRMLRLTVAAAAAAIRGRPHLPGLLNMQCASLDVVGGRRTEDGGHRPMVHGSDQKERRAKAEKKQGSGSSNGAQRLTSPISHSGLAPSIRAARICLGALLGGFCRGGVGGGGRLAGRQREPKRCERSREGRRRRRHSCCGGGRLPCSVIPSP